MPHTHNSRTSAGWALFFGLGVLPLALAGQAPPPKPDFGSGITVVGIQDKPTATVFDLSWKSVRDNWKTIQAFAVLPKNSDAGPGIFYFHQLGQQRDRNQFLSEALELAAKGVRSVLINGSAPWTEGWKGTAEDAAMIDAQLAEVETGIEVLKRLPGTDAGHLAFVGHDYGAMFGALMYARSKQFCAYCLIAPAPEFADWIFYFNSVASQDKPAYTQLLAGRDPLVALAGPAKFPLLLQFANNDNFVSKKRADDLGAVATGAVSQTFQASHNSVAQNGKADRHKWLLPLLGIQ